MTTWTVLVIAVFLNATDPPKPFSAVLVPGVKCDEDVATDFAEHMMKGAPILSFSYSCDEAQGPEAPAATPVPAPAKKLPGKDEA